MGLNNENSTHRDSGNVLMSMGVESSSARGSIMLEVGYGDSVIGGSVLMSADVSSDGDGDHPLIMKEQSR